MRTRTEHPDIPDVWASTPVDPPSRRYGADTTTGPWSRLLDWLGAVALLAALIEEIADAAGIDLGAAGHLIVAAGILTGLAIYGMRVGTRDIP